MTIEIPIVAVVYFSGMALYALVCSIFAADDIDWFFMLFWSPIWFLVALILVYLVAREKWLNCKKP